MQLGGNFGVHGSGKSTILSGEMQTLNICMTNLKKRAASFA
jgi:hypothetical protein